ncbi:hypothetical protein [Anaerotignum sp. MB30-C6]|uniref:hypothetical protein n=1 Tax=Anaerotignum sp. MB30-C6 TaxID=3070814 RepID=UPI0027DB1211|nr:hypothetical protein [Anaerotignum sp. MB30-C6]WMI80553.1 hypothetical protein RBQ60_12045 [Anaerotignum sp. MB30-C6]
MLYIIGTKKEAERLKGLFSNEVFTAVVGIAKILDEAYGEGRNIFEDDGGYVCIVESNLDVDKLKAKYQLDLEEAIPEYCTKLSDEWLQIFLLCNNEFGINIMLSTQTTVSKNFYDYI